MRYGSKEYFGHNDDEKTLCLSRIAESYSKNDLDNKALTYYQKALTISPYNLKIRNKLAVHLLKLNRVQDSKKQFYKVLNDYPENKQALCNLGYIFILEKNFIKSEYYLFKAIQLDPNYLQAYENLILMYKIQNKKEKIVYFINKILEIDPDHKTKVILDI